MRPLEASLAQEDDGLEEAVADRLTAALGAQ